MGEHTLVRLGKACWQPEERRLVWTKEDGSIDESSELRLTQKQYQLMMCLYQAAPEALKNEQIVSQIWGENLTSAESLPQLINKTRNALRDDSKSIITFEKGVGYKLNFSPYLAVDASLPNQNSNAKQNSILLTRSLNITIGLLMILLLGLVWDGVSKFSARDDFKDIFLGAPIYPKVVSETDTSMSFEYEEYTCVYKKQQNEVVCEQ